MVVSDPWRCRVTPGTLNKYRFSISPNPVRIVYDKHHPFIAFATSDPAGVKFDGVTFEVVRTRGTHGDAMITHGDGAWSGTTNTDRGLVLYGKEMTSVGDGQNIELRLLYKGTIVCKVDFGVCSHPIEFEYISANALSHMWGVRVEEAWNNDSGSGFNASLDEVYSLEALSGHTYDDPPFNASGPIKKQRDPEPMNLLSFDDYHAIRRSLVYNYQIGSRSYSQVVLWSCHRCLQFGDLTENRIVQSVVDIGPPGFPDWWIVTTIVHTCPGIAISIAQDLP